MARKQKHIYFDYAATTSLDPRVRRAMDPFFSVQFGNPGSLHRFGVQASRAVFEARRSIGVAIGASPHEVIFTASATEANNLALRGVIREFRVQGLGLRKSVRPRIIVSAIEHESILETARDLEKEGAEVVVIPVSRYGSINLPKLEAALNDRTVLVSVMYANNEIGTIQPIIAISDTIKQFKKEKFSSPKPPQPREHGPRLGGVARRGQASHALAERSGLREGNFFLPYPFFHTDAAQALQYLDCDVTMLGVDLMTLSAHKIYGPKGVGALYMRRNQKSKVKNQKVGSDFIATIISGGGQEYGLRSGTENVPGIVGFAEAVRCASLMRTREARRVSILRDSLWQGFRRVWKGVQLNGPSLKDRRLPNNLNVYVPGIGAQELLVRLDLWGVAVSAGSACAAREAVPSHVLQAIGCNAERAASSIRFTIGRFTTRREIDAATRVLNNIRGKLVSSN